MCKLRAYISAEYLYTCLNKVILIRTHVLNLQVQGASELTFLSGDIGRELCWDYPIVKWLETAKSVLPVLGPQAWSNRRMERLPPLSTLWLRMAPVIHNDILSY